MNGLAISLAVGASAFFVTAASAAPLSADVAVRQESNIQNVRLVCNESGHCWCERSEQRVIVVSPAIHTDTRLVSVISGAETMMIVVAPASALPA